MKREVLYKKRNGSILKWEATIEDTKSYANIVILSGKIKDKPRRYSTKVSSGKNLGKKNATTYLQQAEFDLESKINKKLMEGYTKEIIPDLVVMEGNDSIINYLLNKLTEGIDKNGNVKPMLAASYFKSSKNFKVDGESVYKDPDGNIWRDRKYYYLKNPHLDIPNEHINIKFPCSGQAKLNGVRCTAVITIDEVKLFSKEGTAYNVPHIITELYENREDLLKEVNDDILILDGELYLHGYPLETIVSSVGGKIDMFTPKVNYFVYDIVNEEKTFFDRNEVLNSIFTFLTFIYIENVNTYKILNNKNAQQFTDNRIKRGYEGAIFRNINSVYQPNKRLANTLIKLKRLIQAEFDIKDIVSQEKDVTLGLFKFTTKEGENFEINPTFVKDKCRDLLENKNSYIGKKVTLTFYEYTEKGIPKHCIDTIIRDYE